MIGKNSSATECLFQGCMYEVCSLQVEDVKQVYQSVRSDVDTSFSVIYNHAVRVAEAVGTEPMMPRLVGRQQHRSNVPAVSVREYYQRNLAIPLLDT